MLTQKRVFTIKIFMQENIWNHTFLEHTNNQEGLVLWGRGKDGLQFLRVTLSVNLS